MHLAAFVEDVVDADRRLSVRTGTAPARTKATVAGALPGVAVRVDSGPPTTPARLVHAEADTLAILIAPDVDTALVLDGGLAAIDTVAADRTTPLAGVDEATIVFDEPGLPVCRAAAESVAALARASDGRFYASVDTLELLDRDQAPTGAEVYGARSADDELDGSHIAVATGDGTHHGALLAVADGTHLRGFVTLRSTIVEDLEAYLDRTYKAATPRAVSARGT